MPNGVSKTATRSSGLGIAPRTSRSWPASRGSWQPRGSETACSHISSGMPIGCHGTQPGRLHIAELSTGRSESASKLVAGGDDESVVQPPWGPDGSLYFLSDRYRFHHPEAPDSIPANTFNRVGHLGSGRRSPAEIVQAVCHLVSQVGLGEVADPRRLVIRIRGIEQRLRLHQEPGGLLLVTQPGVGPRADGHDCGTRRRTRRAAHCRDRGLRPMQRSAGVIAVQGEVSQIHGHQVPAIWPVTQLRGQHEGALVEGLRPPRPTRVHSLVAHQFEEPGRNPAPAELHVSARHGARQQGGQLSRSTGERRTDPRRVRDPADGTSQGCRRPRERPDPSPAADHSPKPARPPPLRCRPTGDQRIRGLRRESRRPRTRGPPRGHRPKMASLRINGRPEGDKSTFRAQDAIARLDQLTSGESFRLLNPAHQVRTTVDGRSQLGQAEAIRRPPPSQLGPQSRLRRPGSNDLPRFGYHPQVDVVRPRPTAAALDRQRTVMMTP